ncbi:hypothetical protein GGI43DRAFT_279042 [Trichoderma evansii]
MYQVYPVRLHLCILGGGKLWPGFFFPSSRMYLVAFHVASIIQLHSCYLAVLQYLRSAFWILDFGFWICICICIAVESILKNHLLFFANPTQKREICPFLHDEQRALLVTRVHALLLFASLRHLIRVECKNKSLGPMAQAIEKFAHLWSIIAYMLIQCLNGSIPTYLHALAFVWPSSKQPGRHVVLERGQSDDNNSKLVCNSDDGGNAVLDSLQNSNWILQMFASLGRREPIKLPCLYRLLLPPSLDRLITWLVACSCAQTERWRRPKKQMEKKATKYDGDGRSTAA